MATAVLAGSKGVYNPINASDKVFGNKSFTVVHDTCLEADELPVKFDDGVIITMIPMKQVKFTNMKTRDYDGKST